MREQIHGLRAFSGDYLVDAMKLPGVFFMLQEINNADTAAFRTSTNQRRCQRITVSFCSSHYGDAVAGLKKNY